MRGVGSASSECRPMFRPVKNKKSFLFFVLEFKLELELGLGLKLE